MSSVVGMDLGFQNSVIAAAGRGGVDVILNGNSNRLNPSMVGFQDSRKMGEHATPGMSSNYKNTIKGMKRLVGLSYSDPRAQKEMRRLPLNFQPLSHPNGGGPDSIGVEVNVQGEQRTLPIEMVAGMIIQHMGTIAAEKAMTSSGSTDKPLQSFFPQDWVIAIPNYYTDAQRRALLNGCQIVGVDGVQRLMHENTATALAYGIFKDLKKVFTKDKPTQVMFIDMGASSYTVSVAAFEPGKLTVKSAYCDADLGGRDFDDTIANHLADQFEKKFKNKLSAKPMERPKTKLKLLTAAEKAKKTLSPHGVKEARVNLEMLQDDLDFSTSLKADEYEAMCAPLLARLEAPIRMALEEANLKASDLDSVEVVGGSTRIGSVKRKLGEILGMNLSTTMNADEAVARGAALQSAILSPRFKVLPYEIVEAQPYPILVKWDEGASGTAEESNSVVMFNRGLSFPIVRRVTLKRSGKFTVTAAYDPSSTQKYGMGSDQYEIAKFHISNTSTDVVKVRVNVKEDIHGVIQLSSAQMVQEVEGEGAAADGEEKAAAEGGADAASQADGAAAGEEEKKKKVTKTNLEFTTQRPLDWTMDEINKFNELEVSMANNDRLVRETADMRNELESYIYDMRDKISSDSHLGPYGSDAEKEAFVAANTTMENWLYEDGFDATKAVYQEKLGELKALGGPIEKRQREAEGRAGAVSSLQANIELYQNWSNSSQNDEKYSHIKDEDRGKLRAKTDEISGWLFEMLDKQGALANHQDPILTIASLQAKEKELINLCYPIMNMPKPPPPKPKQPAKDTPPAADKGGEEKKPDGDAMETEGTEQKDGGANESEPMDTTS